MKLLIVTCLISSSLLIAQSRNVQIEEMQIPQGNNPIANNTSFVSNQPNTPGEEFLVTGYDYMTNNSTRAMIDLVDLNADGILDPIMVAMGRLGDPGGDRLSYFGYKAFGVIDKFLAFDTSQGGGFPVLQYCVGGPFDGEALVMGHFGGTSYHSRIDLVNFEPVLPFPQTTFGSGSPSFVYTPDAIIASSSDLNMYASTDAGATFDLLFPIGDGDPEFDETAISDGPAENPVQKSADNMTIQTFGIYAGPGTMGNPDVCYLYGSRDGGVTWSGSIIGVGSGLHPQYGQIVNRDYAPYFENFAQVSLTVDDLGISHITANGYGEGLYMGGPDTVNVYPMLYWNSNHQNWIAVTPESMEAPDDGFGTDLATHRPGNGIGNSYGSISVSDNGQIIFVAWQGPEYTGEIGNSPINLFPGDGGPNTLEIFYTDIYYTVSFDGGATWETSAILQGDAGVMEEFPVLASRLVNDGENGGGNLKVHFLYLEDAIPGVSLFSENEWSNDCVWYYQTMTFPITGVEDEIVINNFTLEQNYPNPFNPSTLIQYAVSSRQFVSMKVYDVLGNEIATLVNEEKPTGIYEVEFDASNLPSGIYIYTLSTGEFTQSKKMLLLK